MKLDITSLKEIISKVNLAVEKSKLNPRASWIELERTEDSLLMKVANMSYSLEAHLPIKSECTDHFNVTLLADTFIPLLSKLDVDTVSMYEKLNMLVLETDKSSYSIPIIKELGKTKQVDLIKFDPNVRSQYISSKDITMVADINTKGLADAVFAKDIQQYIYVDNKGAITFTENIYVTEFSSVYSEFKMLLTMPQAKLLGIFAGDTNLSISFEQKPIFEAVATMSNKVCVSSENMKLIMITQPQSIVDKFPSIKLRSLAESGSQTRVTVDKKQMDRALERLMIFDKKFDITVMDYSKIVFKEDGVHLISIKNKNVEKLSYIATENVIEHESVIRFADLVKQLKAVKSKELVISYGDRPAIIINSGSTMQILPEIVAKSVKV